MRYFLYMLFILCCNCSDDDKQELSFEALCNYTPSSNTDEDCSGNFLVHIDDKEGEIKYSEELGYYVSFSIEKTYDCNILGVICTGDYANSVGSTVNVTADIHEYDLNQQTAIGGQKIVSLTNLNIN